MRTLSIGGVLAILVFALSACGGSSGNSASERALQREADEYQISQIEKIFHESMSKKNVDMMMSLWAPHATFTYSPGQTATGRKQIRAFWLTSRSFLHTTHWISDHPAYKLRITINGDRGTLSFECHFIDLDTHKVDAVTAADMDVARVDGRWLITKMVGGTAELKT
jgi:ketosteroid isomerase-like protein